MYRSKLFLWKIYWTFILLQVQLSKVTLSELQTKLQLSSIMVEYIMYPVNFPLY